jgi:mycothiol synthase
MTTNLSIDNLFLEAGLRLRSADWNDAEAIAQVVHAACAADGDAILATSAQDLMHGWQDPDFNLNRDAFVVETREGRIVGYADVSNSYEHAILNMDGNAHPAYKRLGIGTTLLRAVERRAREMLGLTQPDVRVVIKTTLNRNDRDGDRLHQNEGYQPIRYHWRMEIELDGPPAKPIFPTGIELRPFVKGEHDVAVWQAQNEAFRDHPDSHDWTLEEWRRNRVDEPEFDPSLWALAWDGDANAIAGFALNRYRGGIGWIRMLGVRRPWRKRGLGEALLLHSFGEFYGRGMKTIGLGVNAHNPTGATRLYQKVGMHAASEHVTYEKELRPGHENDQD